MTDYAKVTEYIQSIMPLIVKDAKGKIPFPWLALSYSQHYQIVFCWDYHHMAMRFAYAGKPEYMKLLISNLLFYQTQDGYTPNALNEAEGTGVSSTRYHAQPYLMQSALMYLCQTGDLEEIKNVFGKLTSYLSYFERFYMAPNGLFRWPTAWMSGIDNDAATSFTQPETVISADLSSWMVLEYRSAAQLAKRLGRDSQYKEFAAKADFLTKLINEILWCEEAGSYSAYNLCSGTNQFSYKILIWIQQSAATLSRVVLICFLCMHVLPTKKGPL